MVLGFTLFFLHCADLLGEMAEKLVQITCYPSHFVRKLEELRESLTPAHYYLLDQTPFAHFFHLGRVYMADRKLIHDLCKVANLRKKEAKFF